MCSKSLVIVFCVTSLFVFSDVINAQTISCYVCAGLSTTSLNTGCGLPFNQASAGTTITAGCSTCGYKTVSSSGLTGQAYSRSCLAQPLGTAAGCATVAGVTTCNYECSGTDFCIAGNSGSGSTSSGSRVFIGHSAFIATIAALLLVALFFADQCP